MGIIQLLKLAQPGIIQLLELAKLGIIKLLELAQPGDNTVIRVIRVSTTWG
jgi:hypothetical protein